MSAISNSSRRRLLSARNTCAITVLGISASPTVCPLRGYGRAGTQNHRLGEAVILSTGTPIPAHWTCRRRCLMFLMDIDTFLHAVGGLVNEREGLVVSTAPYTRLYIHATNMQHAVQIRHTHDLHATHMQRAPNIRATFKQHMQVPRVQHHATCMQHAFNMHATCMQLRAPY